MLTEAYIAALLVDEAMADWVWEAWDVGLIPDEDACWAWIVVASKASNTRSASSSSTSSASMKASVSRD